ncbi:MAG: hypothetical protein KC414_12800, partial [Romboutsia sp.]|nr:hypothetical protein [Romboutsia sp.]
MENKQAKIPVRDWIEQYKEQFERYNAYCESNDWRYAEDKEEEYEVQNDISKLVLNRLKYFVDKFEPYLEYKYVQEFIELMTTPVNLFLERCNDYFLKNNWLEEKDKETQVVEMKFQADMMSHFNSLKDTLQKLNLDNEIADLELPIHSDKKIPFLMADVVERKFPQIIQLKDIITNSEEFKTDINSHTVFDILDSTEFYKNIKNPPVYDLNKHYFEQKKDVLDFYTEELNKIRNGVIIAGVYIHGWLYWHMNYFMTDLPMNVFKGTNLFNPNKDILVANPPLRDNEWFYIQMYQEAEKEQKGLFTFGTRRYSKTVLEASFLTWRTTIIEQGENVVIGGDERDLKKLSKTLEIGFSNVHPAFRLTRNNNDWNNHIQFGLKDKTNERVPYSDIFILNVNGGRGQGTEKAAGSSPSAWIADEAGKFNIKTVWESALPSFKIEGKWRTTPLLSGTGGNVELSVEAQEMLLDPEPNEILSMNWDKLEAMVKEEDLITWKRRTFGVFLPTQMSLEKGLYKKESNLSEFLDIADERLKQIDIKVTDWALAKQIFSENREKMKNAKDKL